ncbi:MAG TPA: 3'(2'),5'-bisphosphate nucleotidase [Ilumatobacter sp.]|nr:3'(2'),5'-bisphosphate nucleotidase [Ilumatobacter sp.]
MVTDRQRSAALDAVRAASESCAAAQGRLAAGDTLTKGDASPVTVADFAAQAIVCATLVDRLGAIELVGEESSSDLADNEPLRDGVIDLVAAQRGRDVSAQQVLEWISVGHADGLGDRHWTLDPIDGTKGFLRGDQYAIALALIEDGEVVLGVLGCPNLPNPDGSRGAIFVAVDGTCEMYGLVGDRARPVQVAAPATLAQARLCESVEAGHSNHDHSSLIAARLGITAEPYRIDSQCKYGAVARGDASIYLRLPTRADYREKVWDHAAGKFVVEQAGGRVTDVDGLPLDFSHGRVLEGNRGVIATDGRFHDRVVAATQAVLAAG